MKGEVLPNLKTIMERKKLRDLNILDKKTPAFNRSKFGLSDYSTLSDC